MEKPIRIRLHVLSPIHIGCDDVYEPTSFVIDETKKKLIEFDPLNFVERLTPQERREFSTLCAKDDLLPIFKFIKRAYKPTVKTHEVEISDELVSHYKKVLALSSFDKKAVINQFTIHKTAYNPQNYTPYIPGSSLKGVLRTAYLSVLSNIKKVTKWSAKADELETKLLERTPGKEKMSSDPFRLVKVSDMYSIETPSSQTKIVYAVNKKKKISDRALLSERGSVYQIFEIISPGTVFQGTLNIESSPIIKAPVSAENLLPIAHSFYAGNLKEELIPFRETLQIKHQGGISANAKFKESFKKTAFLIRIGRHSGAEALTIEGNRNIKIMQGAGKQPKYLDHATTFWLASDEPHPDNPGKLLPFGWAVLEVMDGL